MDLVGCLCREIIVLHLFKNMIDLKLVILVGIKTVIKLH